jgi:hypothetical protein
MLEHITPVLLTFNEAANIGRTLSALGWARDIVVVDSGSTDGTLAILGAHPQVRVFHRAFDSHANQWRFATAETAIATSWIFRLDADYHVTPALRAELTKLDPDAPVAAYRIAFDYAVFGRTLRTSLYPPNTILLRQGRFSVNDRGHTEVWTIDGPVRPLSQRVVHDDRKPAAQWLHSQVHYMERELSTPRRGLADWLRRHPPLMPLATLFYCLFVKRLFLDGRAGLFYTMQRVVAETMLSFMVIDKKLRTFSGKKRDGEL